MSKDLPENKITEYYGKGGGVYQVILNLDQYYETLSNTILLNNYSLFDIEQSNECFKMLMNTYDSETISTIPECMCGFSSGTAIRDMKCPKCGFKVAEKGYDPVVWVKAFTPELRFIHPVFYGLVNRSLKEILPYLTGLEDTLPSNNATLLANSIVNNVLGGERSYAVVAKNLRAILVFVSTLKKYKDINAEELIELYDIYEENIYVNHLPLISPMLFNITKTNKGRYVDIKLKDVLNIAADWLRAGSLENNDKANDKLIAYTLKKLYNLLVLFIMDYVAGKVGVARKQLYSAKSCFSYRCVIVSRAGPHTYDEIEVPWVTLCSTYRLHVLNKLMKKYGYTYKEALKLIHTSCKKYNKLIDDIGKELIAESKYKGLPVIAQRNPSLLQGSAQLVYIVKFKTDPDDNTMGISALIAKAFNADYDGDKLFVA